MSATIKLATFKLRMNLKKIAGFTLVEILIVVSVMGILSSLGFVSYINFSRKQILVQNMEKVITDLQLAQSLALNNQKMGACETKTLDGSRFTIESKNGYSIYLVCGKDNHLVKSETLPPKVELSPVFWEATFKVLRQGVSFSQTTREITVSAFDRNTKIKVGEGGEIRQQ